MSCPICFGGADAATRESLNAGIFVLLGVTVTVLGFFARFFLMLAKRGRESFFEDTPAASAVEGSVLEATNPDAIDRRVA